MEAESSTAQSREFHIAILGATGVVGRLIAEYLCKLNQNAVSNGSAEKPLVRFLLCGRNQEKLQELKNNLCKMYKNANVEASFAIDSSADVKNRESILRVCKRTNVLISVVGPYLIHGETAYSCCVEARTHYCDITGETPFAARMQQKYGKEAQENNLKLVSFCGYDSIPSDLCAFMIQETALKLAGKPCEEIRMGITRVRGGVSGSTIASILNKISGYNNDDLNPYYMCKMTSVEPLDTSTLPKQHRVRLIENDPDFGYGAFNIMASVNENVVHWSNFLQNWRYGKNFRYKEMLACKYNAVSAFCVSMLTYFALLFVAFPVTRWIGKKLKIIPEPGDGPSRQDMDFGYFKCEAIGRISCPDGSTRVIRSVVGCDDADPGYKGTAMMVSESALTLAFELEKCSPLFGSVSPAAGIGKPLIRRLRDAGMICAVDS